jgi:hypothetical protein
VRIVKATAAIVIATAITAGVVAGAETRQQRLAHHSRAVWLAEVRHARAERHTRATLHHRAVEVSEWTHIAVCEEGGWIGYAGPAFPNSLGITSTNWSYYGGGTDLRPFVQVKVAERIEDPAPASCPW